MLAGARGVISVTANVVPQAMHALCAAAASGDAEHARRLDAGLQALHRALSIEPNPIPAKWAVQQLGRIAGGIRLPLTRLTPTGQVAVRAALRAAGGECVVH